MVHFCECGGDETLDSLKAGNFLATLGPVSFRRRTLYNEVS